MVRGIPREHLLEQLKQQPDVEWAVEDRLNVPHALPDDWSLDGRHQWYLRESGYIYQGQPPALAAIDAAGAWNLGVSGRNIVVAVLDTGIVPNHPDLAANVLPGYDFIENIATGSDGDPRDPDPTDPGVMAAWHGTKVAGIIAAVTNNGMGVAGIASGAKILPVRVLGAGGGFDSDIIAGMRWAAGLEVNGIPTNPNPARILNLSLGSPGGCSPAYDDAIRELLARDVLIVVSAGNAGGDVDSPGNCGTLQTLTVAGVRHAGTKVGYSNFGQTVGIAAPAGNCVNLRNGEECLFSIDSTTSPTAPGATGYTLRTVPNYTTGTSFAAPMVAATAALMLEANPALNHWMLKDYLRRTSRAFPVDPELPLCAKGMIEIADRPGQCNCTPLTCGTGMLNASAAVRLARRGVGNALPPLVHAFPAAPGSVGQTVVLDGGVYNAPGISGGGGARWSYVFGPHPVSGLVPGSVAPFTPQLPGLYGFRLSFTDSAGRTGSVVETYSVVPVTGFMPNPSVVPVTETSDTRLMSIRLTKGWNLVGNGTDRPLSMSVLAPVGKAVSAWKWIRYGSYAGVSYPAWGFYAPSLPQGGNEYALAKGYEPIGEIKPGEGFWVNAAEDYTVALPSTRLLRSNQFNEALDHALEPGWNLVATGDFPTPAELLAGLWGGSAAPAGSTAKTLWSWDAANAGWYFWAPELASTGQLGSYLQGKGYLDFSTLTHALPGRLGPGMGFWINMQ